MLHAQKRRSRVITAVERIDDSLFMHSDYGVLKISPKNEYIIRISCKPNSFRRKQNK